MKDKFKEGDLVKITGDNTCHGLPKDSIHKVHRRYDNSSFIVNDKSNKRVNHLVIVNDDDAIEEDNISEINADIKQALNTKIFDREPQYTGGGLKTFQSIRRVERPAHVISQPIINMGQ